MAREDSWVLGHRIRHWDTDGSYGLIEVVSPPKVPGPPPHHHPGVREFFFILKGALDVTVDGKQRTLRAGDFAELSEGAVHTFINNTSEDAVWITGWRPKGFEKFFEAFGCPVSLTDARALSTSEASVRKVVEGCERFGMIVDA